MPDYVIVGGGSAGCVLADGLSADGRATVELLEAGPPDRASQIRIPAAYPSLFGTEYDWAASTVAQPGLAGRELYWPSGRTLGGSSSINAQIWIRGHRADYDAWADAGCPGWSYDDVRPYFHRVERRDSADPGPYGTKGPMWISDLRDPNPTTEDFLVACGKAGYERLDELNVASPEGFAPIRVIQHEGQRWSAAEGYLRRAEPRPNLVVRTGAQALRVLFEGTRAVGVEYATSGGGTAVVHADREVILSAGAVASPRLLLASGVGDPDELAALGIAVVAPSAEVGRNLQDHAAVRLVLRTPHPVSLIRSALSGGLRRYLSEHRGPMTSNLAEAALFARALPDAPAPDVELLWMPVPFNDHGRGKSIGHALSLCLVLLQPDSRGRVTLRDTDPLSRPRIDPGYLTDPDGRDLRTFLAGARMAKDLLGTEPLASWFGDGTELARFPDDDEGLANFVRTNTETLYHPVGTCRMGEDGGSVVDPELRVRGTEGLRVCDASVMPTITRGHTLAPSLMIAARAVDLVGRAED
ncbi:choline dehydrogenase [Solihabitans fulvus]|uniref:Choline dehydrogenase n=1 Tax=Solihabitans fulvus TaxID=1892852 RepID=A0A5B2WDJ8_9PSEU|nr:GMC family oxidoreductase N-terminal domain-containing protein [Solihabitans fulvus]KAA2250153.1 choline dehydrogenase [Solihabitans fulvus]